MTEERKPLTARLLPADYLFFLDRTQAAGLEGGTACRQLIELVIQHMRREQVDYIDALHRIKTALAATKN